LLGGVPLMLSHGTGSELRRLADRLGRRQPLLALRQPLGYTMVGGLVVSQALTLFTTPRSSISISIRCRTGSQGPKNQAAGVEVGAGARGARVGAGASGGVRRGRVRRRSRQTKTASSGLAVAQSARLPGTLQKSIGGRPDQKSRAIQNASACTNAETRT
jgi:hypothetical protein